ncbi:MAG TPA: hypothetical protein VHL53_23955 [Acidimicrobiia bacterium]|nr:hypothetical protein [Acidimicrobiia bacterium]
MAGDLDPGLEDEVLAVLDRWDRRLEVATAAWADLTSGERQRRSAQLDAAGESDEWVVVLWNWWNGAHLVEQDQLRRDVTVLRRALWAAAGGGRLDGGSDEADSARSLLRALDRMAAILGVDD